MRRVRFGKGRGRTKISKSRFFYRYCRGKGKMFRKYEMH